MPLRPRHGYAAAFHRGLPAGDITQPRSSRRCPRPRTAEVCTATQPQSARFRAGGVLLRGVLPLVPHVHLSVLLAEPAPSGSAGTSRRCQGCCPPNPPVPMGRAALSFTGSLRRAGGGVLSSPPG